MHQIFLSSVQKELAQERRAIADYIRGDALLGKHFVIFLFEESPAAGRRAGDVYLDAVDRSDIYLGVFGDEYGPEGDEGKSATELEFDRATKGGLTRLIYVKGRDDDGRHPRMLALIRGAQKDLLRRRFEDTADLIGQIYASLVEYLEARGVIATRPLDAASHPEVRSMRSLRRRCKRS